ncbi:phosphonate ABC transporter ATP-binding protein [Cellulomonas sp. S1-8]|uniref:phosphonate ABC transporter ATP-binding protein n=1 Tax=Cellulomonas sp. S1-8 TaxID=2904790 RepID=UPI0022439526|nr:phosphonate ABC transporter ATP-binding protein [Cellulomonas sp. S1-8]UZN02873.1 phosphonate ABC transporter ATP-binding protein [Cellulomonas sp. S1-8]
MPPAAASATVPGLGAIRFENVTKTFGSVRALDDVTVSFASNKINVLLGLSGSGKSTMLRHVNGLVKPSNGDVWTLGTPVHAAGPAALRTLRNDVGMIFQQFHLVESMSVLENVCTGKLGSLRGPRFGLWSYPRAVREAAMDQLGRVGLADKAFQRAGTLSGGQQQRVAIARALIQRPTVLLADEPVASLDPMSSAGVIELLAQISREENLTVICSLHQVKIALEFADRIVGLNAGRVVLDQAAAGLSHDDVDGIYAPVPLGARVGVAV